MSSFNKITIVGYLGRDPELRHTPNGNTICNLSIATTEKRGDKESTTWFRVAVWGKQGEMCNEWLAKGRQVYIEGRLRAEEYTDRDGNKRTSLEVNATDVQFLGKKDENGNGATDGAASSFNPRPKTLGDLVTPKQLWMLRNTARELGIDAEDYCLREYNCALEEISKHAASMLIEKIKGEMATEEDFPISQPRGGYHNKLSPTDAQKRREALEKAQDEVDSEIPF